MVPSSCTRLNRKLSPLSKDAEPASNFFANVIEHAFASTVNGADTPSEGCGLSPVHASLTVHAKRYSADPATSGKTEIASTDCPSSVHEEA